MSKKTLIILSVIVLAIVVLLVAGKKAGWFGKSGDYKTIAIQKVSPLTIEETVAATGKIQPEVEVKLSSEVSGEVIELPIVEGQQVKKGDLLIRINPDIYQSSLQRSVAGLQNVRANLNQAEASLKEAEQNYLRSKTLFEKGIIAKSDWDTALSRYEVAQASKESAFYNVKSASATVSEAKDNLERTKIYAPMDGTISSLSVELGERVVGTQQMAGTELMRVANLNNMEVEVEVNENDIVKVAVGDTAIVEVDAYLKKEFKGQVTEIANSAINVTSADQVTNFNVKVRILEDSYKDLLANKNENYSPFRPGMTATVDVITEKREEILGVPISAIVVKSDTVAKKRKKKKDLKREKDKPDTNKTASKEAAFECVFVKEGEKARLRIVTTGIQDDSNIEIISGLRSGEVVITGPYNTVTKILENGDLVTLEEEED